MITKLLFGTTLIAEVIGLVAFFALLLFMGPAGYVEAFGIIGAILMALLIIFLLDLSSAWFGGVILYYFNASDGGTAFLMTLLLPLALSIGGFLIFYLSQAIDRNKSDNGRRKPVTLEHEG